MKIGDTVFFFSYRGHSNPREGTICHLFRSEVAIKLRGAEKMFLRPYNEVFTTKEQLLTAEPAREANR